MGTDIIPKTTFIGPQNRDRCKNLLRFFDPSPNFLYTQRSEGGGKADK